MLEAKERSLEIDRDQGVKCVLFNLLYRGDRSLDPSVVEEQIDLAATHLSGDRGVCGNLAATADIRNEGDNRSALAGRCGPLRRRSIAVAREHACPLGGKPLNGGGTNRPAGSGDDRDLSAEAHRVVSPQQCWR